MLAVYGVISWAILSNDLNVRSEIRWLFHSREYEAAVLAQPVSPNGNLQHIDWDGWGFAGEDTEVYLVRDPHDSLLAAAKGHRPGKFTGLPCNVVRVHRLERYWYFAVFYTDTNWDDC
jgi:hypothetical protein